MAIVRTMVGLSWDALDGPRGCVKRRGETLPLMHNFEENVTADLRHDCRYRVAYLAEAIESLHGGEFEAGKRMLRNYINGTLGFAELSNATGTPPKSLMRMLSENGNPPADKLFAILGPLQSVERVKVSVLRAMPARRRGKGRASASAAGES